MSKDACDVLLITTIVVAAINRSDRRGRCVKILPADDTGMRTNSDVVTTPESQRKAAEIDAAIKRASKVGARNVIPAEWRPPKSNRQDPLADRAIQIGDDLFAA